MRIHADVPVEENGKCHFKYNWVPGKMYLKNVVGYCNQKVGAELGFSQYFGHNLVALQLYKKI